MKRILVLLIVLMAFGLQSCIVKSLHPFYTEADVVFKNDLVSSWTDGEGDQWRIEQYAAKKNAYEMHWLGKGNQDVVFMVHLFKLENELYLDVLPLSDGHEDSGGQTLFNLHLLPTHSIAKVNKFSADEIHIKWFNEDWLKSLFEQNRIRISHETVLDDSSQDKDDKLYILTASTDELQGFILKYGREDAAFDTGNTVWLRLKKNI